MPCISRRGGVWRTLVVHNGVGAVEAIAGDAFFVHQGTVFVHERGVVFGGKQSLCAAFDHGS